jgi:hypothetical protein
VVPDKHHIVSLHTSICNYLNLLDDGPRRPTHMEDYLQTKTGFSINTVYCVGYNVSGITEFIYLLCVDRKKLTSYRGMIKVIHVVK